MKTNFAIFIALIMTLLGACANKPAPTPPKGISSQFETSIKNSGLKVFSIKAFNRNQSLGQAKPKRRNNNIEGWLEHELTKQLEQSQFCNSGHTEIERSIGTGFAIIRGECNELAKP